MKILKKLIELNKKHSGLSKNSFFIALFTILVATVSQAQNTNGFGIRGGVNYNANGDYFQSIDANAQSPERNVGYHLGLFGKIGNKIYLKPEVVYTTTKSDYNNNTFELQKIDAPVLVGFKILGPLSVFAGPSFQYILDSEFEGIIIKDIKDDFSVGFNFGVGFNFKKVGVDLRYERGFSKNEATFINSNIITTPASRLDTRPDQLILSLSLIL